MKLNEFKAKTVPGLYLYDHFEAPNGAFIQVNAYRDLWVYQDAEGNRSEYTTLAACKQAVEG